MIDFAYISGYSWYMIIKTIKTNTPFGVYEYKMRVVLGKIRTAPMTVLGWLDRGDIMIDDKIIYKCHCYCSILYYFEYRLIA